MASPLELMKSNPLFKDFPNDVLGLFIETGETRPYNKGDVIFQEGSVSDEIYLILEGRVSVKYQLANASTPTDVIYLGPGEILGEISFVESTPRSATVVAEAPVKVRVWKSEHWRALCEQHPGIGYKLVLGIAKILCERLRRSSVHVALLNKIFWGGEQQKKPA